MAKTHSRAVADAARELAASTSQPAPVDRELAAAWYPLLREGRKSEKDLAHMLTAIRFDAELVRRLELELENAKREARLLTEALQVDRITRRGAGSR